jgi:hypothetical protein
LERSKDAVVRASAFSSITQAFAQQTAHFTQMRDFAPAEVYPSRMRASFLAVCLAPAAILACGSGPGEGFASTMGPAITTASGGTNPAGSTSGVDSSTSAAAGSTSGEAGSASTSSTSAQDSAASTGTIYDLGTGGDLGPLEPPGCKDKIDFLFMMQRAGQSPEEQLKLIAAFPKFIDTIQDRFTGFDVHILVTDADWTWGRHDCDPQGCLVTNNNGCLDDGYLIPDYPCGMYETVMKDGCNFKLGAGLTFNAGDGAANVPCAIDDDRRYITAEQSNLKETFACMAQVGIGGGGRNAAAIVAAVGPELNDDGGCNAGFLRSDALLMITMAAGTYDEISEGGPQQWADAVFAAKGNNESSVIMLGIGGWDPDPYSSKGRLSQFIKRFPYHVYGHDDAPDYGAHFAAAVELVDEACKGFTPPG